MKNLKTEKGITLIALIITVIVMLILVAVSVSVALQGGIFDKARIAAKGTQVEAEKEELLSAVVAAYDEVTDKVIYDNISLPEGWTESNGKYTSPKENTFTVALDGTILEAEKDEEHEYSFTLNDLLKKGIIYEVHEEGDNHATFGTNLEQFVKYIGFKSLDEFKNSNYSVEKFGGDMPFVIDSADESIFDFIVDENTLKGDGTEYLVDSSYYDSEDPHEKTYVGARTGMDTIIEGRVYLESWGKFTNTDMDEFMNSFGKTVFYLQDISGIDLDS